jgi:hypothetical protein
MEEEKKEGKVQVECVRRKSELGAQSYQMETTPPVSWYVNMDEMEDDDRFIQDIYVQLRQEMSPEAVEKTQSVHIYPSRRCTYTIATGISIKFPDRYNSEKGTHLCACTRRLGM